MPICNPCDLFFGILWDVVLIHSQDICLNVSSSPRKGEKSRILSNKTHQVPWFLHWAEAGVVPTRPSSGPIRNVPGEQHMPQSCGQIKTVDELVKAIEGSHEGFFYLQISSKKKIFANLPTVFLDHFHAFNKPTFPPFPNPPGSCLCANDV